LGLRVDLNGDQFRIPPRFGQGIYSLLTALASAFRLVVIDSLSATISSGM
jgi:hypothetical protein